MHHVIIGNGPAGVIAAETMRKHAPGRRHHPGRRRAGAALLAHGDPLSADRRHRRKQGTHLRKAPDHFAEHRHRARAGLRRGASMPKPSAVALDDGAHARLTTGCCSPPARAPARPPIPGIDLPGVLTCWTLEDARTIMDAVKPGARVLQMGAGFIGCIIMEALAARGAELTVVEMGDRMVPRMMTDGRGSADQALVRGEGRARPDRHARGRHRDGAFGGAARCSWAGATRSRSTSSSRRPA